MLYQKLLDETTPYVAKVSLLECFSSHRHHEIEIVYCMEGEMDVLVENRPYPVLAGDVVLIGSMAAHEYRVGKSPRVLLLEVGPIFLREHFSALAALSLPVPVYSLRKDDPTRRRLRALLEETARACEAHTPAANLIVTGNLYKICACALYDLPDTGHLSRAQKKNLSTFRNVEKALELIYYHYSDPLSVDDAATLSGYGKSNFCKIFKNTVGTSFHTYLNQYRVRNAEYLLCETEMPVGEIATRVGFADSKIFCRVFKSITGMTPVSYRNAGNENE